MRHKQRVDKAQSKKPGKPYVKPVVESDTIYETRALGCAQCLNGREGTSIGWGDGNCLSALENY